MSPADRSRPLVVIVGGGFGGLAAARGLRHAPVDVVLVDRRNFHLFQPLLYQVATGGLSPANISTPFRWTFRHQANADVLLDEVVDFDVAGRRVLLADGSLEYDHLIVATGSTHSYFGRDWEALAPGLKSIEDATRMRSRILMAFERADRTADPEERAALLCFLIVGAGPTGVELAGALAEIARHALRHDFRHIAPDSARILLIDATDRVLGHYPEALSRRASEALEQLGVEVATGTQLASLEPGSVVLQSPAGRRTLRCETVLWAAGVEASPLGARLAERTGAERDRSGRLQVARDLTLAGHPEISVLGDLAAFSHDLDRPLPGVAPVATQQGRYVARRIRARLAGRTPPDFRYRDRGSMATIGRARAVADLGRFQLSGPGAWLLWLVVHIMNLAQAESRVLVLVQWAWSYVTFNRSARLITHPEPTARTAPAPRPSPPHASPEPPA